MIDTRDLTQSFCKRAKGPRDHAADRMFLFHTLAATEACLLAEAIEVNICLGDTRKCRVLWPEKRNWEALSKFFQQERRHLVW